MSVQISIKDNLNSRYYGILSNSNNGVRNEAYRSSFISHR
jgi:hypothetical protein